MPMSAQALMHGHGPRVLVRFQERVTPGGRQRSKALRGHRVTLQLSCRDKSAKLFRGRHLVLGTRRADTVKTRRRSSGVLGGPGADRLTVAGRGGFAYGGLQGDRIRVKGGNGIAIGGPGSDRLRATARRRMMLIGGQGADKLVGGRGQTYINAFDGTGRDLVICRGSGNRVLADSGDRVRGRCGLVRRISRG